MLSFVDLKTSSAKLAEWSPSDWPESLSEMRTIDNLLRCSICYEFFDLAMVVPECSHNYCSLCIRRSLSYEPQCPTCSMKVSPPSLKSNRVLDELVKNFIKVRTKLLELATNNVQTTSSKDVTKKGGGDVTKKGGDEIKNKRSMAISNTKRRKAQSSSKGNSGSSSPDTKRQKLDAENEGISNPVELTIKDEVEDPVQASVPEVVVVDSEENQQDQQQSDQQTDMVTDDCRSENENPPATEGVDYAECPVCGDMVPHRKINLHLDACLTRTEKKSSLRSRKKPSDPKTCKSSKRKCPSDVELQDSAAGSSDDSPSCIVIQEPCSSTTSSSTLSVKGSNALIQTVQKRKPLPKLVYSVMAEKDLRQRLKEWNLSTKGDKPTLVKRHQDFVMLYNAQCDSPTPMTAAQIARQVEKAEKARAKEAFSNAEASTSGLQFEKGQSEEEMDKTRQKYLNEHQDEFDKLIADIRKRQKGKKNKSTAKVSANQCSDMKKTAPVDEDLKKSNDDERDDAIEHNNEQTNEDNTEESKADVGTYPPFFKESEPGSSKQEHCKNLSVIPEPPSSPSLASLEEDENTPSLGLEGDEWEFKDEETGDPLVIPESPVIKVGRATERDDKETVSSESDDDVQQSRTFINNRRARSNLF